MLLKKKKKCQKTYNRLQYFNVALYHSITPKMQETNIYGRWESFASRWMSKEIDNDTSTHHPRTQTAFPPDRKAEEETKREKRGEKKGEKKRGKKREKKGKQKY